MLVGQVRPPSPRRPLVVLCRVGRLPRFPCRGELQIRLCKANKGFSPSVSCRAGSRRSGRSDKVLLVVLCRVGRLPRFPCRSELQIRLCKANEGFSPSVSCRAGSCRSGRSDKALLDRCVGVRNGSIPGGCWSVRPPVRDWSSVAVLGPRAADGDDLEPLGAALKRPHHLRGDPYHIPLAQLDDLLVELHAPGAADDDVGLLLLAVVVTHSRPIAGRVVEVADAELSRVEMLASEARLDLRHTRASDIVDFLQVLHAVAGHSSSFSWRFCSFRG